jgi:hypothetical protein
MTAITLIEIFWPIVARCVLVVIQREKYSLSFYRQHYNSFHLAYFRLSVVCSISYTGVVVYLSTGKLNLKLKLHILMGYGKKRDLNSFHFCIVFTIMLHLVTCIFMFS